MLVDDGKDSCQARLTLIFLVYIKTSKQYAVKQLLLSSEYIAETVSNSTMTNSFQNWLTTEIVSFLSATQDTSETFQFTLMN